MSEYLSEFVQESKESITELNNALLDLERSPDDGSAMDRVFRTAHTLKGNAGAMGLDEASDLAHAIEDLLDAIRAGSLEVTPELMDEVFGGVDDLEAMVEEVESHGEIRTDPGDRIESLRSWVEESTGLVKPTSDEIADTLDGLDRRPRRQHQVFHSRLSLTDDGRSGAVVDALRDAFDLLATDPSESRIRDGDYHGWIDVAFGSAVDEAAIAAALDPVDAVEDAIITEVEDDAVEAAIEAGSSSDVDSPRAESDADPDDMSVDQLLGEFEEYDDLDEAVDRVDDVQGLDMDDLGEAGAFDDVVDEGVDAGAAQADDTGDAEADEEVEDPMAEFETLQEEYDRVGIDEMESELEGVSFGEYDEEDEVGFDELIGDDVADADVEEPTAEAEAPTAEAEAPTADVEEQSVVEAPDDDAIDAVLEAASEPTDPDQEVYHVRLRVVDAADANNGQRVVEALRDAFDVLGTDPTEDRISIGEHDDTIDAVFGAEVGTGEIESALAPVEAVSDAAITPVTDRASAPDPEPEPEPDVSSEVLEAEGEIQNAHSEFQQMQEAFDQVGLEEIESELEDVEFGEYDEQEEVSFDELLDEGPDEVAADADTEAADRPSVETPDEDAIDAAVDAADAPTEPGDEVYHVRLGIVESAGVNNGQRVVEALRDAFDVLGTRPPESAIDAGDHDDHVDAVFASHVDEAEIESALAPVEAVSDTAITPVTDRVSLPEPEPDPEPDAADATAPAEEAADEEVEDPMAEFETLQEEYDRVGIDEMESELEGVSFGEYDEEDEVGFDELLEEGTEADEPAAAEPSADDEAFGEVETGDDLAEAGDEFGEVEVGSEDFGDVEAGADDFSGETDADAVDDEAFSAPESDFGDAGDDLEEVEVDEITVEDDSIDAEFGVDVGDDEGSVPDADESFGDVDVGETDDFGDVDVGEADDFGDVDAGDADRPDEAQADVETIKGIGSGYADRLADADVETVGDLVEADPEALSSATDISESRITEWVGRAPVDPAALGAGADAEAEAEAEGEAGVSDEAPEPEPSTETEVEEIQSVRVDVDRVDELLNLVEGLVTTRARLRRAVEEGADPDTLLDEIDELDVISDEMQDNVVDMRLVPVRTVTQRLPRIVRDIARDQGKRVRFEVEGEDVEIDRSILNRIGDPLMHLVRNAVDHGIEPPEEREARGKDEEGQVTLSVRRQRDDAVIEVRDDGRGLDPDELREMAVEEGILHEEAAEALDDDDAYELIFESGLSTNEEVTDVSGRGVGMDVVATVVDDLDGDVAVESESGEGTTITLRLPVSVAISEVVFLQVGDEEYGVPIKVVDEIGGMRNAERVEAGDGQRIRTDDGTERELIELHDELDVPGQAVTNGGGMLVTIEDDVRSAAIHCDRVRGQQEVVVKPFDGLLSGLPGLSGAAVLGEGEVVNIVDVETL